MSHPARPVRSSDEGTPAPAPERSWYRREPWLAVELAAFVPLLAALVAPPSVRAALLVVAALLVIAGFALLVRQGAFREAPGPKTPGAR